VSAYEQTYLSRARESLDVEEFSFRNGTRQSLDFLMRSRACRLKRPRHRQQFAAQLNLAHTEAAVALPPARYDRNQPIDQSDFPRLAGGTIPFIRKYSTICP
jgi:hypothetical protein